MRTLICIAAALAMLTTSCVDSKTVDDAATTSAIAATTAAIDDQPTTAASNPTQTSTTTVPPSTTTTTTTTVPPSTTTTTITAVAPPTTTTVAPSTTTTGPPTVDLRAVDWANHTYPIGCPTSDPRAEITLVGGQADTGSFFIGLGQVVFGAMGQPAIPVAVVELTCIGAGSWPSTVLIYGGSDTNEEFLGVAASADSPVAPGTHPWEIHGPAIIENGILVMIGEGWTNTAPHCCPDLAVISKVALDENKIPYEVERIETPI